MNRRTTGLSVALAAGLLLAGCSSGSTDTAGSSSAAVTTAASSSTSAPSTTPSTTPSKSTSAATASATPSTAGSTLTAGDGSGELDEQTTTWFSTFCSGLTGLTDLQSISSAQQASQVLQRVGTQMTDTGQKLATLGPPTFTAGDQMAASSIESLNQIGPAFVSFGERAATIQENDMAATQQFATDFQTQLAPLQNLTKIKLDPQTQQAVMAIPECTQVMGAAGGAAATSVTTS